MFRGLILLFLLVPLIELFVLIEVGEMIGAAWTIMLVLGTAIFGAYLVKLQGIQTWYRAQNALQQGQPPALEMLEGATLLVSGFLLLIPGFVTDALGFLLLVPALRQKLLLPLVDRSTMVFRQHTTRRPTSQDNIIEGEVIDDDESHFRR
ncbi:FxsA protein [Methylophaga frappieri]|uniref:FxsA protein n=1 Tax=Methylophaga frappieri (strain ATCC BAA-2434 / DSM 25690 / JAM7) TaxID=754477 RepID=I1YIZ2_METFJ|nr:FxsA family protein [Methylophaga frappieri]AFJ02885.1 FxsA protein [Methylophaga frappieri]